MTENSVKNKDDLSEEEIIQEYKSALQKLQINVNEGNLDHIKEYLIEFVKINNNLLIRFENCHTLIKEFKLNSTNSNIEEMSKICENNNIIFDKTKEKIHLELKNFVINKFIRIITDQDSFLVKQNKEIERIKKLFDKIISKKYLNNENFEPEKQNILSNSNTKFMNNFDLMQQPNTSYPLQESLSTFSNTNKDTKNNKLNNRDHCVENQRLLILDIEADRIYNESISGINDTKKISQSPISHSPISNSPIYHKNKYLIKIRNKGIRRY